MACFSAGEVEIATQTWPRRAHLSTISSWASKAQKICSCHPRYAGLLTVQNVGIQTVLVHADISQVDEWLRGASLSLGDSGILETLITRMRKLGPQGTIYVAEVSFSLRSWSNGRAH
jgi:hypothetical protein